MPSYVLFLVLFALFLQHAEAQGSELSFAVNTSDGLVYFLLILFALFYYLTPVIRYVYVHYLTDMVERAQQSAVKAQKRLTEKVRPSPPSSPPSPGPSSDTWCS